MGTSKVAPPAGVYRDDPDRDDAASISSAVLLGDYDYPEDEPPAYTDDVQVAATAPASVANPSGLINLGWYEYVFLCLVSSTTHIDIY